MITKIGDKIKVVINGRLRLPPDYAKACIIPGNYTVIAVNSRSNTIAVYARNGYTNSEPWIIKSWIRA